MMRVIMMRVIKVRFEIASLLQGKKSRLAESRLLWLAIIWNFGLSFKCNRSAPALARAATAMFICPAACAQTTG
jgi:hypothetical protein